MGREEIFFQLLQIAVGTKCIDTFRLSEKNWRYCFKQAYQQSLLATLFPIVQKYMYDESGKRISPLFSEWLATAHKASERNKFMNKKAGELTDIFRSWGYRSCVLKGQGVATLYPYPEFRQSGDIDLWVDGRQKDVVTCLRKNLIYIDHIDYVHSAVGIFKDVAVEVHFRPSRMYNPVTNLRLQRFFKRNADSQFSNNNTELKFAYPTIAFNLVYSLIHINRHIFEEGIGLRQLMDYFYILKHSTSEERIVAFEELKRLNLKKFTGAIMYILQEVFAIEQDYMLCTPNIKEGEFLLEEIMRGGNFGRFDSRNQEQYVNNRLKRGFYNTKRNLRYLKHYPSEVIWIVPWKLWHWCWRKWKGYL